jgi:hypothetical protein
LPRAAPSKENRTGKAWAIENSTGTNASERQRQRNCANPAPTQDREILFHSLATQDLQRVRIIELLDAINAKLAILVDAALCDERTRT